MKSITIAGNIGRNAETRRTQDGTPVASFPVAVEDRVGGDKGTIWFDVSLWGNRGERLAEYLTKGSKVVVSGDLGRREYNDKTYLTVRANDVTLMGGRTSNNDADGGSAGRQQQASQPAHDLNDDIPF